MLRPPTAAALLAACLHAHGLALTPESTCSLPRFREAVLEKVNAARAKPQRCGAEQMAPAPPLRWNDALFAAAARHAADMAQRDYFDHRSPEGVRVGPRVSAEGYTWRSVGENLAGGDRTVEGVVAGWLRSPTHCSNLMQPHFEHVGVACVHNSQSTWGNYWTMVLGRQRPGRGG